MCSPHRTRAVPNAFNYGRAVTIPTGNGVYFVGTERGVSAAVASGETPSEFGLHVREDCVIVRGLSEPPDQRIDFGYGEYWDWDPPGEDLLSQWERDWSHHTYADLNVSGPLAVWSHDLDLVEPLTREAGHYRIGLFARIAEDWMRERGQPAEQHMLHAWNPSSPSHDQVEMFELDDGSWIRAT